MSLRTWFTGISKARVDARIAEEEKARNLRLKRQATILRQEARLTQAIADNDIDEIEKARAAVESITRTARADHALEHGLFGGGNDEKPRKEAT